MTNATAAPAVIQRWHAFIDSDLADGGASRTDQLHDMLADDVVFLSPAIFSPQEGKAKTAMYLEAAAKLFSGTDFHYVGEWYGERSAVLEFAATIDGKYVNGVDMIAWGDDELITSFKVMVRPFQGLQSVMGKMAALLSPN